jgi:transposase
MIPSDVLANKFAAIQSTLTERGLRLWAAAEAQSLGHGGIKMMAHVTGLGRETVARGIRELAGGNVDQPLPPHASRRQGGGRKKLTTKDPTLLADLDSLVSPATRGHPESALLWTAKSTAKLATELQGMGQRISERSVATLLKELGYSLQAMSKTREGGTMSSATPSSNILPRRSLNSSRRGNRW